MLQPYNKVNTHCDRNARFPALIRIEWFSLVMLDSGQVRTFEEVATAWVAALPAASEEVHCTGQTSEKRGGRDHGKWIRKLKCQANDGAAKDDLASDATRCSLRIGV